MAKFRKKPIEVEAVRWWGKYNNPAEWPDWFKDAIDDNRLIPAPLGGGLFIYTLEGGLRASIGDVIIRGIRGELYPCKPDIFEESYEAL